MAFLGHTFDPNSVQPADDFTPLPSGEYLAVIIDSEMLPNSKNTGTFLKLTFKIIDGPMQGRLVWARLNLENPNPKAVEIAQRELSAICHAVGHLQALTDSEKLHNRPMVIRVEYVKADGVKVTRDSNEVKAYKRIEGAAPASPFAQQHAAPQQASAPAATQAPSWMQRPAA